MKKMIVAVLAVTVFAGSAIAADVMELKKGLLSTTRRMLRPLRIARSATKRPKVERLLTSARMQRTRRPVRTATSR